MLVCGTQQKFIVSYKCLRFYIYGNDIHYNCVMQVLYEKLDGNRPHLLDSQTCTPGMDEPYISKTFSPDFHQFVEICCSQQPQDRLACQCVSMSLLSCY